VTEAKSHFREVIDRALSEGPQTIARRGREAVVVVSAEVWNRMAQGDGNLVDEVPKIPREGTLADFFRNSPLNGSGIDLERVLAETRKVTW
jgi:prevent-host-death family protein